MGRIGVCKAAKNSSEAKARGAGDNSWLKMHNSHLDIGVELLVHAPHFLDSNRQPGRSGSSMI